MTTTTIAEMTEAQLSALATRHQLRLLSAAAWRPVDPGAAPPSLAGFIASSFSPLVAHVTDLCLSQESDPLSDTAIVITSGSGDAQTAQALSKAVDRGERVPPLLFFQAVPNAVAGYIAAKWGLAGPVVCLSPARDALDGALTQAGLLLRGAEASAALVIWVEQASASNGDGDGEPATDIAIAMYVTGQSEASVSAPTGEED